MKASMSYEEAMIFFWGRQSKKKNSAYAGKQKNEVEKLLPAMLKTAEYTY